MNQKKALEQSKVKEVILKKINLIKEGKKWMNLLNAMLESNVILLIKVRKEYRKHKSKKLKNEK